MTLATDLVRAHQAAIHTLTAHAQTAVQQAYNSLPDLNSETEFVAAITPVVVGAQHAGVHLTDAFIATLLGRALYGIDAQAITDDLANQGVGPDGYANALTIGRAGGDGLAVALGYVQNDVQRATRATNGVIGRQDESITGWNRVPEPGACEFCLLISEQTYGSGDLAPGHVTGGGHNGGGGPCGCTVAPITADANPGGDIAAEARAA